MPKRHPPKAEPKDSNFLDSSDQTDQTENGKIVSQPAYKSTVAKLRRFIDTYAKTGYVNQSCEVAGIARATHYHKLKTDPAYQRAFDEAQEQVGRMLEDLAVQRVRDGNRRLVLYQGEPVTVNGELLYEVDYDTRLHCTLLKRFKRLEYCERASIDLTADVSLAEKITEARARIISMQRRDGTE